MTHVTTVTCRLTAKNRNQLQNPTLGSRVRATFTFTLGAAGNVGDGRARRYEGGKAEDRTFEHRIDKYLDTVAAEVRRVRR